MPKRRGIVCPPSGTGGGRVGIDGQNAGLTSRYELDGVEPGWLEWDVTGLEVWRG